MGNSIVSGGGMGESAADDAATPTVSKAERATLPPKTCLDITDEVRAELTTFIDGFLTQHDSLHSARLERAARWREYLATRNPVAPTRIGLSNVCVPFILEATTALRQRIVRGINGQRSVANITPGTDTESTSLPTTAAFNKLTEFFDRAYRNERDLNGETTVRRAAHDQTAYGVGCWAVVVEPAHIRKLPSIVPGAEPTVRTIRPAIVRWERVRFDDMIYEDGLDTDFESMAVCGYYTSQSWADIAAWSAQRHYYPDIADRIKSFYTADSSKPAAADTPQHLRPHRIAPLCIDWDIDGDGYLEPVIVTWHPDARLVMRVAWNIFAPYRPLVAAQFDPAALVTGGFQGQGVPEKLESAQEEINSIHNTGIEAAKRAILPITLGRSRSEFSQLVGRTGQVIPGEHYDTADPEKDLRTEHLASGDAVQFAIVLEQHITQIASKLLGRNESTQGEVSSAKRVPGGLGTSILQESRIPVEDAMANLGGGVQRGTYLTLHAWSRVTPIEQLQAGMDDETIRVLMSSVLSPSDLDIRKRVQVVVKAQDAAAADQAKQQTLMVLNNFLFGHFDRLAKAFMLLFSPETPPAAKPVILLLVGKMQKAVELLLKTMDEVEDPRALLISLADVQKVMEATGQPATIDDVLGAAGGAVAVGEDEAPVIPANGGGAPGTVDMGGGVV